MSATKILAIPGAAGLVLLTALGLVSFAGCGASPRSIAVDATTIAHDAVDESTPKIEKLCVVDLPELKEPQWSERSEVCDVVVPAHDALALAVSAAKKALATATSDGSLLGLAGELAVQAGQFALSMAKLGGAK